jgi:DNA primase
MDAKEEIRARLSVEDVIGEYLELRPSGSSLKALSPFSHEKTASFMVSPEKQIWHDFSTNKGGDIFTFVMEMEGVDFRESLEILARKAGLDLAQFMGKSSGASKIKPRLLAANKLAGRYYLASLSQNPKALAYVTKKRGYTAQTIKDFGLGYAPRAGSALVGFLKKNGFSTEEIKKAGLGNDRYGSLRDMFRGRLLIPLADGQGQVIGFTGRILDETESGPKYLNTPQTLLYDKSRHVFGLHLAKDAIRDNKEVVIVEGNLDVVASHQAGVKQVVATAGTALTTHHLNQLKRLATKIKLSFDSDRAGLAATERAIVLAQNIGVTLYVVNLPGEVKDPDELIKKDVGLWTKAIDEAPYVVDWVIDNYKKLYDLKSATGKRDFSNKVAAVLKNLQDPVEKAHYATQISEMLGISVSAIEQKITPEQQDKNSKRPVPNFSIQPDNTADEDNLLALSLAYPQLREILKSLKKDNFSTPQRQELFTFLTGQPDKKINDDTLKDLPIDENYAKILMFKTEQQYEALTYDERYSVASHLKRRLLARLLKIQQQMLTAKIKDAENSGDLSTASALLKKYQLLIKEASSGTKEKT